MTALQAGLGCSESIKARPLDIDGSTFGRWSVSNFHLRPIMRILHLFALAIVGATAHAAASDASGGVLARHASTALKRQLVAPSSDQLDADIEEWAEEIAEDDPFAEEMLKEEFPSLFEGDEIDDSLDDEFSEWDAAAIVDEDEDDDGYYELVAAAKNGTRVIGKHGRATIISTPVLTALLITLLIVLPVLFCGISALASIQVRIRARFGDFANQGFARSPRT